MVSRIFTAFPRKSISFCIRYPTTAVFTYSVTPTLGAVSSVSCSKCIVYKYVAKGSQIFAELILVLCLFCTVTCVLKKNYVAVFHCCYSCFAFGPTTSGSAANFTSCPSSSERRNSYRCKRQFRFRLSLWFSQMGAKDYLSTVRDQFLIVGRAATRRFSSVIFPSCKRNVKVTSYKDSLSFYVDIVNRLFISASLYLL